MKLPRPRAVNWQHIQEFGFVFFSFLEEFESPRQAEACRAVAWGFPATQEPEGLAARDSAAKGRQGATRTTPQLLQSDRRPLYLHTDQRPSAELRGVAPPTARPPPWLSSLL